jgi:uncharacterized protein YuzE
VKSTYDDQADALYVALRENVPVARSVLVDDDRVVDVDDQGEAVGIEVLGASHGVRLTDLVERFRLHPHREALRRLEASRFNSVEFA